MYPIQTDNLGSEEKLINPYVLFNTILLERRKVGNRRRLQEKIIYMTSSNTNVYCRIFAMSTQASLTLPRKQKPRELKVEYSSVSQQSKVSESTGTQIIYVYCSPRLKHALTLICRMILLAYCVVIPFFVFMLHQETTDSLTKLDALEQQLSNHISLNKRIEKEKTKREVMKNETSSGKNGIRDFTETYRFLPKIEESVNRQIKEFNETITRYEEQMEVLTSAKNLLNEIERIQRNNTINKCQCLPSSSYNNPSRCNCSKKVRGPRGQPGRPGLPGRIVSIPGERGAKGDIGPPGEKGENGRVGKQGIPGFNSSCRVSKFDNISTVYVKWGSRSCNITQAKRLYTGYMSGPSVEGGGSNYLCLPDHPKYKNKSPGTVDDSAEIDGVKYGTSFEAKRSNRVVYCAVCETRTKVVIKTFPAMNECPTGWEIEYEGYLAAHKKPRTEHVCVERNAQRSKSAAYVKTGTIEKIRVEKCGILPCADDKYNTNEDLTCVVCSK